MACKSICEICLCLGNTQLELCILDNYESVAHLHLLIFVETNLAYESRHSCVYRSDMLTNGSIVSIFHVAIVEEFIAHDSYTHNE